MSEDIKKTINELHIYEKKLLKELEANPDATPEEIAENTGMDIKSVMSAAGSLASKDIIEVEKDVAAFPVLTKKTPISQSDGCAVKTGLKSIRV